MLFIKTTFICLQSLRIHKLEGSYNHRHKRYCLIQWEPDTVSAKKSVLHLPLPVHVATHNILCSLYTLNPLLSFSCQ